MKTYEQLSTEVYLEKQSEVLKVKRDNVLGVIHYSELNITGKINYKKLLSDCKQDYLMFTSLYNLPVWCVNLLF